jgi:hypothetical protein
VHAKLHQNTSKRRQNPIIDTMLLDLIALEGGSASTVWAKSTSF